MSGNNINYYVNDPSRSAIRVRDGIAEVLSKYRIGVGAFSKILEEVGFKGASRVFAPGWRNYHRRSDVGAPSVNDIVILDYASAIVGAQVTYYYEITDKCGERRLMAGPFSGMKAQELPPLEIAYRNVKASSGESWNGIYAERSKLLDEFAKEVASFVIQLENLAGV